MRAGVPPIMKPKFRPRSQRNTRGPISGHCHASRVCVIFSALKFQFPRFAAHICHPQFGNDVAQGEFVVSLDALQFTATEPPFELPFGDTIVEISDDEQWVTLRDRRQSDLAFSVDRAILDNGFFLKPYSIRNQVQSQLGRKERRWNFRLMVTGLVAVVVIAWAASHVMHWGVRLAVKGISAKHEIEFGDEVFEDLKSEMDVIPDTNGVARLDALMAALSPAVHARVPFKFSIVAGPPNAFALPGGRICVTTGLLRMVDTPEQLLGVFAHESAHITQRHAFQQSISGKGPIFLMQILTGSSDKAVNLMAFPSELLINASFSQAFEAEADALGWDYLMAAKINPRGQIEALQKLKQYDLAEGGAHHGSAFNSHPDLDRRIKFLESRWSKISDTNHFVVLTNALPKVEAGEEHPFEFFLRKMKPRRK
jgi:beta-barrel assembly-enhancing protease